MSLWVEALQGPGTRKFHAMKIKRKAEKTVIGWREWLWLPQLGIEAIKAKIDTGARSSSLHAFDVKTFPCGSKTFVRFSVHPFQRSSEPTVACECEVLEFRKVRSSSGHQASRPVILTEVELVGLRWPIELTLANRDEMGFRMLLGREAIRGRFLVDAGRSFLGGKRKAAVNVVAGKSSTVQRSRSG